MFEEEDKRALSVSTSIETQTLDSELVDVDVTSVKPELGSPLFQRHSLEHHHDGSSKRKADTDVKQSESSVPPFTDVIQPAKKIKLEVGVPTLKKQALFDRDHYLKKTYFMSTYDYMCTTNKLSLILFQFFFVITYIHNCHYAVCKFGVSTRVQNLADVYFKI